MFAYVFYKGCRSIENDRHWNDTDFSRLPLKANNKFKDPKDRTSNTQIIFHHGCFEAKNLSFGIDFKMAGPATHV